MPASGLQHRLQWEDPEHLRVGEAGFLMAIDGAKGTRSTADHFVLMKNKPMVDGFLAHAPHGVENIVDLGIFKGGSIAFYHQLFLPRRIVGIELHKDRVAGLDDFISRHSLGDSVHLHYGTNQSDRRAIAKILRKEFGDQPLDLVIDDCSHRYGPAKASLNLLLPRLRPGGVYLIEDWGWAHWPGDHWQGTSHQYADEPDPMSKLILELVMVAESRPGLIRDLSITGGAAYLTRGDEIVPDDTFDVSSSYLTAGRSILY
ncbi:MAG TPA: class I SAM-dependent methyltransferase [Acidimicrobiales bacterium]|nr:class I SAM-dependent methyltransferase [Acidimicrobiales bacterium]